MKVLLLIFIGGGVGSVCRYGISRVLSQLPPVFPWATLAANAISCIILGFLVEWSARGWLSNEQRMLLMTGFCGGFSTFSTFTNETYFLYQRDLFAAIGNVVLSVVICMICLILGMKLAARV
jgi:CrcB protein